MIVGCLNFKNRICVSVTQEMVIEMSKHIHWYVFPWSVQSYKYVALLNMYFKNTQTWLSIKSNAQLVMSGMEWSNWDGMHFPEKERKKKIKQIFPVTSEGPTGQETPNISQKMFTSVPLLLLLVLLFWEDKLISPVCSLGILSRHFLPLLTAAFHLLVLGVCTRKVLLKFNTKWVTGLWWASSMGGGSTMG